MSTREPASWRPLPLPVSCGLPVLLVSANMGSSSYVVSVSDMANIWSESLDRKAICMRAWSENTSIDPSDTAENMNKLLSCLKTALDPTQDGHDTTSFSLSPATAVDAGEGGLTIKVTCRLPGLGPLRWPIHLKKQSSSAIATDLVLPLIQAQSDRRREVNSLMDVIKRKDAVITKISDKLQAMGAGLEHVFTALSGRKSVTRANAEDRVKGVGLFNESKWEDELDADAPGPGSVRELVQGVFGERGLELRTSLEINASPELDRWWHDFQPTAQISQQKQAKDALSKDSPPSLLLQSTSCDDDDDFQIQSTPPCLKSTEETTHTADTIGKAHATVEEDQDLEAPDSGPPSALSNRTRQPETGMKSSRLGAIGAKKQLAQPRHPSPPSGGNTTRLPLDDDEETASEASEEDDVTASQPNSSPESPSLEHAAPKQSQRKGSLGIIGGGTPKTHSSNRETEAATTKEKTHPATLGTIGGKLSKPGHYQVDECRGRFSQHKETSSWEGKPRETSQERADRRREEIKRELEKKAAAGPAKKKRRF
ncbi:hypothetical protein E4U42_006743 [Claviceps africana]|uniref:Non-homologous end-joining factor 1 n=1 Tax=Claviceps africana TaxID=83212 RepID=A0A8K0J1Z6_9HYPO|nr:hypothetical protein E4U42_006743 [Claviceps africana]